MQVLVRRLVVRFLKQDVRPDARFLQLTVVFHRRRRNVDIDTADCAVFMFDAVDRLNTLEHILYRAIDLSARFQRKPLVSHVLQGDDFVFDLLLRELPAANVLIRPVIRAVTAFVDTVIRQIQRRKHDDSATVDFLFHLDG